MSESSSEQLLHRNESRPCSYLRGEQIKIARMEATYEVLAKEITRLANGIDHFSKRPPMWVVPVISLLTFFLGILATLLSIATSSLNAASEAMPVTILYSICERILS